MLLNKLKCPYGCENSNVTESLKRVATGNSNLLLDSAQATAPVTEMVKVYSCTCCGKSFESHQPSVSNGRMIL